MPTPTAGSSTRASPLSAGCARHIDYLTQIAKAAEQPGFEAVPTPTGAWCENAWLTTVALSQHTERSGASVLPLRPADDDRAREALGHPAR